MGTLSRSPSTTFDNTSLAIILNAYLWGYTAVGIRWFFRRFRDWHASTKMKAICVLVSMVFLAYLFAYGHFRSQHEITHYKSWSNHNHHRVRATSPGGRDIFMASLLASMDGTNAVDEIKFDQYLDSALRYYERRERTLGLVFAPLRWGEAWFWYVVDFRRDA